MDILPFTSLIENALKAATAWLVYSVAKMKVESMEWKVKNDEKIKEHLDAAADDPRTAPAHIAAAELLTEQATERSRILASSPL